VSLFLSQSLRMRCRKTATRKTSMNLVIQDPDDSDSIYLVEALLEACQGAHRGGGTFAFATSAGAKLFLEDEVFVAFAAKKPFELIVGIDAITTNEALTTIRNAANALRMKVYVFLNDRQKLLFHPKFCWFRSPDGGQLIVGSGNLTIGGLRANWEAFSINQLTKAEADKVEKQWARWIASHSAVLLPPDDPRVIARATENNAWVRLVTPGEARQVEGGSAGDGGADGHGTVPVRENNVVLIAEIPKSGNRWNQANFDLEHYERFFGAKRGTQRRILLQHVDADGRLAAIESRPSVAVKSQNYRFELQAASGLAYPKKLRPIAVFVRVATRTFRYRLLMPSDTDYSKVRALFEERWTGPSNQVRRISMDLKGLRQLWHDAPFN
jgi:hypothetical protein